MPKASDESGALSRKMKEFADRCRDAAARVAPGGLSPIRFIRGHFTFERDGGARVWSIWTASDAASDAVAAALLAQDRHPKLRVLYVCTLGPLEEDLRSALRNAGSARGIDLEFWDDAKVRRILDEPPGATSTARDASSEPSAPLAMVGDRPWEPGDEDHLDFEPYADALATLIDNPRTETPLTLAVNAPWGAGKTSLARMVVERLNGKPAAGGAQPHVVCWFDAWMHDDADRLSSAFVAHVAQTAARNRPLWRRLLRPLAPSLCTPRMRARRRVALSLLAALGVMLLAAALWIVLPSQVPDPPWLPELSASIGAWPARLVVLAAAGAALSPPLALAATAVAGFVRDPASEAGTAGLPEVRRQLHRLIHHGTPRGSRFIVFIDDLERCRPPRGIEMLETVNQLLSNPRVVVVLLADMSAIHLSAEVKYEPLVARHGAASYGRLYVQKIVQVQLDLPAQPPAALQKLALATVRHAPKIEPVRQDRLELMLGAPMRLARRFGTFAERLIHAGWLDPSLIRTAVALLIAVGGAVALLVSAQRGAFAPGSGDTVGILLSMAGVVLGFYFGRRGLREAELQSVRARIDAERSWLALGGLDNTGFVREDLVKFVRERELLQLANDSDLVKKSRVEMLRHLPANPRNVKRAVNRLRLLVVIAERRGLFNREGGVDPAVLGKWIAFHERWPGVAELSAADPTTLQLLEDEDPVAWERLPLAKPHREELEIFLAEGPSLAAAAHELAYCRPITR